VKMASAEGNVTMREPIQVKTDMFHLLRDYLRGLLASACGIDPAKLAADAPLLALGIDSYAAISIQQSILADLGAHVTASDLAHAASLCDLATRLDEQLSADIPPSRAEVPASAPVSGSAGSGPVRLYCWASGSRVPVRAALSADLLVGERGRWPGAGPRWAALGAVRRRGRGSRTALTRSA
jgi:Phosphopantetheine attachment site